MAVAGKAWPPRKKEENSSQQISLSLLPQTLCRRSGEAHPNAQPGSFHTDFSMETKPASPGGSCSSGCCPPGGEQSEIALCELRAHRSALMFFQLLPLCYPCHALVYGILFNLFLSTPPKEKNISFYLGQDTEQVEHSSSTNTDPPARSSAQVVGYFEATISQAGIYHRLTFFSLLPPTGLLCS